MIRKSVLTRSSLEAGRLLCGCKGFLQPFHLRFGYHGKSHDDQPAVEQIETGPVTMVLCSSIAAAASGNVKVSERVIGSTIAPGSRRSTTRSSSKTNPYAFAWGAKS